MVDHTRHIGIFSPVDARITLIGAGGIGALTALMLSKMSDSEIVVYDNDTVDDVNIATQFHKVQDVEASANKADAICRTIREFSDSCIAYPHANIFPDAFGLYPSKFVISAVDSINSRKSIWSYLMDRDDWEWYLDARMSAEVFQLYTVNNKVTADVAQYAQMLSAQNEDDIPEIACTMKATIYTAAIAAGHIGKTIREIQTGINPPYWLEHDIIRERILVAYGTQGRSEAISDS